MKLSKRQWKYLEIIFFWLLLNSNGFWKKFRFIYKHFSVSWLLKLYRCHHYHKNYHKFSSLNTNVLLHSSTGQKSNRLGWFLHSGFHKAKPRWHRGFSPEVLGKKPFGISPLAESIPWGGALEGPLSLLAVGWGLFSASRGNSLLGS